MGELNVDGDDALVAKAQKVVELRIPVDYALLRELAVQGLSPSTRDGFPSSWGARSRSATPSMCSRRMAGVGRWLI